MMQALDRLDRRKILRYIKLYQKAAKPFRWKYSDPSRRSPDW
jgi:hypothetical protein